MPVLETERLVLRELTLADLDDLYALYKDPEIRQYYPEGTLTYAETREELEWIIDVYYAQYGFGLWAAVLKETGQFVGRCGLLPWVIQGRSEVEIAYLIAREHWRKGLGGEAAQALVRYGFEQLRLPRLIALIDPQNPASINTARHAGLAFEREYLDKGLPTVVYALANPRASEAVRLDVTRLTVDRNPSAADRKALEDGLYEYNSRQIERDDGQLLHLFLRSPQAEVLAGLTGWTWAGACEIQTVWVQPALRGQGYGRKLLEAAEREARARGAQVMFVNTYNFQAPVFYEKLGFEVVSRIAGLPPGHQRITLRKRLR